ncbi:hypothetical protein [Bacillus sp. NPDC094077]
MCSYVFFVYEPVDKLRKEVHMNEKGLIIELVESYIEYKKY